MSNNSISLAISNAWASFTKYKKPAVKCQTPLPWGESGYETTQCSDCSAVTASVMEGRVFAFITVRRTTSASSSTLHCQPVR